MEIRANYQGDMRFQGGEGAAQVLMDAKPEHGGLGQAHSPKQLVLQGLAGCTGMDVVSILKKMKVEFSHLAIEAKAQLTEEHPKVFSDIQMVYRFQAKEEDREKIEKAISLSQDKYCGVGAMLSRSAKIGWVLELDPA